MFESSTKERINMTFPIRRLENIFISSTMFA